MNKTKIALDYVQATQTQTQQTLQLEQALQALNPDNQVFGLADLVQQAYTNLVKEILGPDQFSWLEWWMYETNYGTESLKFTVNNKTYDPKLISLSKFLNLLEFDEYNP